MNCQHRWEAVEGHYCSKCGKLRRELNIGVFSDLSLAQMNEWADEIEIDPNDVGIRIKYESYDDVSIYLSEK